MRMFVLSMVLGLVGLVGCGGKDKPPLTPDQDNPALDAGVDPAHTPSAAPPPPTTK